MGDERARLQEIFEALVSKRLAASLEQVEEAIARWRRGEGEVLAAHAEAMRHAARAGALSGRVARAGMDGPEPLLRDAFDLGIVSAEEFLELVGRPPAEVDPPPSLDDELDHESPPAMPKKRVVVDKLMGEGPVLVHLDPRRDGVDVPAGFRDKSQLVLRFGWELTPPIPDLIIDDDRLVGTLTFRGVPHRCLIPWTAVFAVVAEDGRGLVWPEDVPPEVADEYRDRGGPGKKPDPEPPKPRKGGHLKLV